MVAERPRNRPRQAQPSKAPLNYYRSAEQRPISPFEKKKPPQSRKLVTRVVDFVSLAVALLVVGYCLVIRPHPKVLLNSSAYHSANVYQIAAQNDFQSLKNRTKLTLDENSIIANLQKRFPEIISASVELPLFSQTPQIKLNIAQPELILNNQGVDYIIDSEGRAVARKSDLPHVKGLTVVIDQTGFNITIGAQVLSQLQVNFIKNLLAQCQKAKLPVASLTLPRLAQELDLRTTDQKYYTKFYLGGDALLESGQFLAARQQFKQTHHQPARYLDVRVSGKIYYK